VTTSHIEATQWPVRLRSHEAAKYLRDVHGLPFEPKTLRNWRAGGRRGPSCRYLGTLPLYDRAELDRWAQHDALTAECPTGRKRTKHYDGPRTATASPATKEAGRPEGPLSPS
jgi:hypothetical protein